MARRDTSGVRMIGRSPMRYGEAFRRHQRSLAAIEAELEARRRARLDAAMDWVDGASDEELFAEMERHGVAIEDAVDGEPTVVEDGGTSG